MGNKVSNAAKAVGNVASKAYNVVKGPAQQIGRAALQAGLAAAGPALTPMLGPLGPMAGGLVSSLLTGQQSNPMEQTNLFKLPGIVDMTKAAASKLLGSSPQIVQQLAAKAGSFIGDRAPTISALLQGGGMAPQAPADATAMTNDVAAGGAAGGGVDLGAPMSAIGV